MAKKLRRRKMNSDVLDFLYVRKDEEDGVIVKSQAETPYGADFDAMKEEFVVFDPKCRMETFRLYDHPDADDPQVIRKNKHLVWL